MTAKIFVSISPVSDPNDKRLNFLLQMATLFKLVDNSKRGKRCYSLTNETANDLHQQTLNGIVDLIKNLLASGHKYLLPGKIQRGRIEAEFAIYRQLSGGNFFISALQVLSSLRLQHLKHFHQLDVRHEDQVENYCCILLDLQESEDDLELVEQCTFYYISGYIPT